MSGGGKAPGAGCPSGTANMGLSSCKERRTLSEQEDLIEAVVCNVSDINENEMKEVSLLGDKKILLIKQGGTISAIGNKCSHYGAPLMNGALGQGRVRCPWHGACFNIKTGDIEDFPGLDSVPCYDVHVEEGQVKVRARRGDLESPRRVRGMSRRDPNNSQIVVIAGGGGAGATCAEALRQEGFTGRVILICKEAHLPYDRPKLSKAMDTEPSKLYLRTHDFYKSFDIQVQQGVALTKVDPGAKKVTLNQGGEITYDALFLATGSDAREMKGMPGGTLRNILPLRSVDDANKIAAQAKGKRIVMLGNSFIGMEVAAYLADKAASVAIVGLSDVPFEPVLGREVGERLGQLFTEAGATLHGGRALASFQPDGADPEAVGAVILDDGTNLPAELVILGLGVVATTGFLEGSGIKLEARGNFVTVDKHLLTSAPGVWAGGDIAATPLHLNGEDLTGVAIGHWQVAHYHGKVAATNIVATLRGKAEEGRDLATTPFYWTVMFGRSLRYAGYGVGFTDVKVVGDLTGLRFAAYYLKGDNVIALATLNSDPLAAKFAERLAQRRPPLTRQMLEQDSEAWTKDL